MAACIAQACGLEAAAAAAASAESTQWVEPSAGELMDEDEFIQDDDDASASCSEASEADSADVLEALIQAELSKFQQQQADKYAARASEGQPLVPLSSPAPRQQQLRAQQKQQEALIDAASFEEQEQIEYVPSTRTTLEPEQLQHLLPSADSCSHMLQPQQGQQDQRPPDPDQLCSESEGAAACAYAHIASAEPSSVAAADAAQVCSSSSCAEPVAAAAVDTEPLQLPVLTQPHEQGGPVKMECVLQELSKLQLARASQESTTQQCSGTQEGQEAAAAGDYSAQDSMLLQDSSLPLQQPLQEPSDDAVECPELPHEQQPHPQEEVSEGPLQAQQEACDSQQDGGQEELEQQAQEQQEQQQQQEDGQHGEEEVVPHTPEMLSRQGSQAACQQQLAPAESAALVDDAAVSPEAASASERGHVLSDTGASDAAEGDAVAISPAAASASERGHVLSDTGVSNVAEGFIYQDDSRQSASPGNHPSSPDSPAQAATAAEDSSSQAPAARASSDASAAGAAAAAFAATALGAASTGEVCPWETYTADAAGHSSAQQPYRPSSCSVRDWQSRPDSSTGSAPRLRQQSPRQQQQQSPRAPTSPPRQSPRRPQQPQQQQQQCERRSSAELCSPAPPQYTPRSQQARGAGPRPSSAPVGGSRRPLAVAMTGPAAAQLALRQAPSAALPADRTMMPVVAESSQEGPCGCPSWGATGSSSRPSSGSPMQFFSGAAAAAGWAAAMHHQQGHAEDQYQQTILARMQQVQQPQQQLSRPASAGPWPRSKSQPRAQRAGRRPQAPAWDDSPMPLDIPGRVPIAQAVQLPSTTVASNAAYFRGWGTGSPGGSGSGILGGSRAAALAAASRAAAGSRPQTAGPVMVGRISPWEAAQLLVQDGCSQQLRGCRTARSASSSPERRRAALLITPQAAAVPAAAGVYGVGETAGYSSMQVTSGCSGAHCSALDELPVTPAEAANSSLGGARASSAAPYLLGVQQQIRQANSYCRQLGLPTQYKLAEGSSRKDRWQLEQIQVELWAASDTADNSCQQQSHCQVPGSGSAGSTGGERSLYCWQLKKSLSLQQLTAHLNRLKGSVTPAAGVSAGLSGAVQPRHSTHAAFSASRAAAAAGGGAPNGSGAAQVLRSSQRPQSPDRARQAALVGGGLGGTGQTRSRVAQAGSASACQLLVLSPRGSSSGEQVQVQRLVRPVSAPKSRSRLSPPRRHHV